MNDAGKASPASKTAKRAKKKTRTMSTTTQPLISDGLPHEEGRKTPGGFGAVADPGTPTITPADIASWEAALQKRDELCLTVAGTRPGQLTLFAGPDKHGTRPVAVLTGLDTETYVSRAWTDDIEEWITSILQTAETLIPGDRFAAEEKGTFSRWSAS